MVASVLVQACSRSAVRYHQCRWQFRARRLSVMATSDIRSIADWLIDGARSTLQAYQVLRELCNRLVGCGIPLWRVSLFVRTLHPHIMGRRFIWRPEVDVEVRDGPWR